MLWDAPLVYETYNRGGRVLLYDCWWVLFLLCFKYREKK